VTVFLLREDRHFGVVLPRPHGGFVEFGYGDWDWYALGHDRWWHVFDTVLWPTTGALGRREIPGNGPPGQVLLASRLDPIEVERRDAEALLADLEARFERGALAGPVRGVREMVFVPHERGFWCLHNCSDAAADWLRRLGCSVSRVPIRGGLALETRPPPVQ
jgi:hypothetical protein